MLFRHRCEKCEQWHALQESAKLYGERYGETWSGVVNGERVWYDVSAARSIIGAAVRAAREGRTEPAATQEFSVSDLWEHQVKTAYVVAEHLAHVDTAEPVIMAVTHVEPEGEYLSLIDGTHRLARAYFEKRPTIAAYRLSYAFSKTLKIDSEAAVTSEIVTEALASGATVEAVADGFVIRGGSLRPSTADDHPLRAVLLERLRAEPCELVIRTD